MKTIVHISTDFPDPMVPAKTRAILNLVDGTPGFRHIVYSLNRINSGADIAALPFGEDRLALAYPAPPNGLLLATRLSRVARWIGADFARRGIAPDLIHAHKLTMEGLIGLELSGNVPLIVNIQGNTDTKIARARRDLAGRFRAVAARATHILSFAPWSIASMANVLGENSGKCRLLPVITHNDRLLESKNAPPRLVSLFNLDSWRSKGADMISAAAYIAAKKYPELSIDIFGAGSPSSVAAVTKALAGQKRVRLLGALAPDEVQDTLNRYAGFIMPSLRESYGLAYVEAMFSGLPLIYSKARGIDGILPEEILGYACDPSKPRDVAHGICHVLDNQTKLKAGLKRAQANGDMERFRREPILREYRSVLDEALSTGPQ